MVSVGLISPPDQPPARLLGVAEATEAAGLDELWLWEDCFAQSGIGPAAAVLGHTARLRVGIGLMPAPLRNVALAAMEIATLAELFPGRLVPGVGHGVQSWMAQAGVRAASPMTLLREYVVALRALLEGETVTTTGTAVILDDVTLRWPPSVVPPLFVGAVGPKTLALAGELADGVIFTGSTPDEQVRAGLAIVAAARSEAGRDGTAEAVVFVDVPTAIDRGALAARLAGAVEAGATRLAVLAIGDDGPPEATDRILDLVTVLGAVADEVR